MGTPAIKKKIGFKDWIDELGVNEVAALLRVERSTVRHWRRGLVLPRDDQKLRIWQLSKGGVSLHQMIVGHFSSRNTARKKSV